MTSNEPQYSVYIVMCNDKTLYTGISNNIEKRIRTHNLGKGAKYTRGRLPVTLVWTRHIGSRSAALKEEYKTKKLSRSKKLELIKSYDMFKDVKLLLQDEQCPFCKTSTLYERKNHRSDASFMYYIHCSNCKKWVGRVTWDGTYKPSSHPI